MKTSGKVALGVGLLSLAAPILWLAWWLRGTSPRLRRGRAR